MGWWYMLIGTFVSPYIKPSQKSYVEDIAGGCPAAGVKIDGQMQRYSFLLMLDAEHLTVINVL